MMIIIIIIIICTAVGRYNQCQILYFALFTFFLLKYACNWDSVIFLYQLLTT